MFALQQLRKSANLSLYRIIADLCVHFKSLLIIVHRMQVWLPVCLLFIEPIWKYDAYDTTINYIIELVNVIKTTHSISRLR